MKEKETPEKDSLDATLDRNKSFNEKKEPTTLKRKSMHS